MGEQNMVKEKGKYIYGIIPKNPDQKNLSKIGDDGVYLISCRYFSALVTDSKIVDYTQMSKGVLTEHLLLHQKTIEDAMNLGNTIVPFKLGTFAKNEHEVQQILHINSDLLEGTIEKVTDKFEINVIVVWNNLPSILNKISEEEKKISELKESLKSKSRQMTEEDQIQIGRMVELALREKNNIYFERIFDALVPAYPDVKIHETAVDQIVFNATFLLNKQNQEPFVEKLTQLSAEFNDALNFRYMGPLPCYSFYSIEVKKTCFSELDQARKKLRLQYSATKDEIKKAYKSMAFSLHPDRKIESHGSGSEEEFNEINNAYKVLLDYCSYAKVSKKRQYSFLEKDINKNSFFIKLRS
ncbi:MAG: GvpL/GvpF family gas vesicle protein [Bacteroidetes bacterium]|nr:GvpL/GvpF family gas vesicle protein [Bacteroidota bacterium]